MRLWFSGPRVLGGLVRPGVNFGPEDLRVLRRMTARERRQAIVAAMAIAEKLGQPITRQRAAEITDEIIAEDVPHQDKSFGTWLLRHFSYAIALAVIFTIVVMTLH